MNIMEYGQNLKRNKCPFKKVQPSGDVGRLVVQMMGVYCFRSVRLSVCLQINLPCHL